MIIENKQLVNKIQLNLGIEYIQQLQQKHIEHDSHNIMYIKKECVQQSGHFTCKLFIYFIHCKLQNTSIRIQIGEKVI